MLTGKRNKDEKVAGCQELQTIVSLNLSLASAAFYWSADLCPDMCGSGVFRCVWRCQFATMPTNELFALINTSLRVHM